MLYIGPPVLLHDAPMPHARGEHHLTESMLSVRYHATMHNELIDASIDQTGMVATAGEYNTVTAAVHSAAVHSAVMHLGV